MVGDDLSHSGSVEAVVLRSRRFYVPDSPELFSEGFCKLLMAGPLSSRIPSIVWQWNCPMGFAANVPQQEVLLHGRHTQPAQRKNARFYMRVRIGNPSRLMAFFQGVFTCQRRAHSGTLRPGHLRAGVGVGAHPKRVENSDT